MHNLTVNIMLVLDGIVLYAMLHHLVISQKGESRVLHSLFALVCLFTLMLSIFHMYTIESRTIGNYLFRLKFEHVFALMLVYSLTVFLLYYAGRLRIWHVLVMGALFAILIVANQLLPYSLQYHQFYGIVRETMPWGQVITTAKGRPGFWAGITSLIALSSFGYGFWSLFQTYRKNRERAKLWMLVAFSIVVFCTLESILVRLEVIHVPILVPYDILGLVILMSGLYILESQLQLATAESNFRELFEGSPTAMVSFSPQSGQIFEANPVALELTGYWRKAFLSLKVTELGIQGAAESFDKLLTRLRDGEDQHLHYESQIARRDGTPLQVDMYFSAIKDKYGQVVRVIANVIDVAEARLAQQAISRESEKNQALLRSSSDGIHIVDPQGYLMEASDSFLRKLGYTRKELIGSHIAGWNAAMSGTEIRQCLADIIEKASYQVFETVHQKKDGSIFPVEIASTGIMLEGKPYVFNASRDITARKQALNRLKDREAQFHTLFTASPIGIAFCRDGKILEANGAFKVQHGHPTDACLTDRPLADFFLEEGRKLLAQYLQQLAEDQSIATSYETEALRQDGSVFPVLISMTSVLMADGPMIFCYTLDFTELKQREQQIQMLAFYDQLTKLPNRHLMNDRLTLALSNAEHSKHYGAVLLIDLDNFKSINDTLGHDYGDSVLQQLAQRLLSCLKTGDTLARLGGDEFLVILESLSDRDLEAIRQTELTGQRLLKSFERSFVLDGREFRCSACIGVTLFNNAELSVDERIKQADIAMYKAKDSGRNTMQFFDPRMQESVNRRARDEADLYKAIEGNQFELHYQLQVDGNGRPFGAEALIRWRHPERGLVYPDAFIPLAEETGQILEIGTWVINAACQQISLWQEDPKTRSLTLSFNISSLQFKQRDFATLVKHSLERHGAPAELLKIELTESVLLDNAEHAIATMHELRELGIRFSLDDFGTGFSSLQYLKRLPLDQLKIDKSFITGIVEDHDDLSIVQTITGIAHELGYEVIAEGVENERQRALLASIGCHAYQGYLFGYPIPIGEFFIEPFDKD